MASSRSALGDYLPISLAEWGSISPHTPTNAQSSRSRTARTHLRPPCWPRRVRLPPALPWVKIDQFSNKGPCTIDCRDSKLPKRAFSGNVGLFNSLTDNLCCFLTDQSRNALDASIARDRTSSNMSGFNSTILLSRMTRWIQSCCLFPELSVSRPLILWKYPSKRLASF